MIVTDFVKPDSNSWNKHSEHSLEPTSTYINNSAVKADIIDSSLIFVHTHPGAFHPPTFSPIDESSNHKLFRNLSQILPHRPLGSVVFSRKGVHGVVFEEGKTRLVSTVKILGHTYSHVETAVSAKDDDEPDPAFDRQTRAIGRERQLAVQDLRISLVGAGGTGSAVAVQLAKMGVGKLNLVDKDVIDESNISRVYGSKKKDVGKPKVDVLKKHISSFSKTKVKALRADITAGDVTSELADSDLIFGCTDNLTSRSILNDIALQYYVPLIDIGCRIHLNDDGSINQAVAKVQVVTPDTPCLWCTGTLDGRVIMQESLPGDERKKLAGEGYYEGIENQPSVISLTALAASLGVNKLLGLLGAFGEYPSSRTQVELRDGFMIGDAPEIKKDCVCHKLRGLAQKRLIPTAEIDQESLGKSKGAFEAS